MKIKNKYNPELVYNVKDVADIRELYTTSCEDYAECTAFLWKEKSESESVAAEKTTAGGRYVIKEKSYRELFDDIKCLATYLNSLGLENRRIALSGSNCYRWALTYLAVLGGVGVIVPLDNALKKEEAENLTDAAEASAIVIERSQEEKYAHVNVTKLYFDEFDRYIEAGAELIEKGDTSYENHRVDSRSLGILLFTSGTMGNPKGIMLSQYNVASDTVHVMRRFKLTKEDRCLSVLPLHHTYECMAGFLSVIYSGGSIAYATSIRRLTEDFGDFKPTIFCTVPMILESFERLIKEKYRKTKGGNSVFKLQRRMALRTTDYEKRRKIFHPVTDAFGGRLKRFMCGAAPLSKELFDEFETFGIETYSGYGLTETSPVCIMHNDFYRSGEDNGYPISGVKIMIDSPDENGVGELCVKGSNVMLGYYKAPELTAEAFADGWFHTGDLAVILENGAVRLSGRKKSMIVLKSGKKVFPEELEDLLDKSKYVSKSLVFCEEENGNTVLCAAVLPDSAVIDALLEKDGITPDSAEYDEAVKELVKEEISKINRTLQTYKIIKKIIVRRKEFVTTSTKKIKRFEMSNREEE